MPKSKHRHKGSGKAVKNPGRQPRVGGALAGDYGRYSPARIMADKFYDLYLRPFDDKWGEKTPHQAFFMLEVIADMAADNSPLIINSISKEILFEAFTHAEPDADMSNAELAEAALAFLAEQGMVTVDGDQITIPEQFIPKEGHLCGAPVAYCGVGAADG